jgi:hypothetical protein
MDGHENRKRKSENTPFRLTDNVYRCRFEYKRHTYLDLNETNKYYPVYELT